LAVERKRDVIRLGKNIIGYMKHPQRKNKLSLLLREMKILRREYNRFRVSKNELNKLLKEYSISEIARMFNVDRSTVRYWKKKYNL